MKYRILHRLKSKALNNKKIYGFDVETFQTDKGEYIKQDFLMGSIVGKDTKEVFYDNKEMAREMLKRKYRNALFFATNLEFDFEHTFKDIKEKEKMFFIDHNGLIFVKYKYDKRNSMQFLDTWNYTGKIKLEKMGELVGLKKLDQPAAFKRIPKTNEEWAEMKKYNLRDSEITYKFAESIRDFCDSINAKLKITLASMGLDFWRRNFQPIDIFQEKRHQLDLHYKAFHGGRVEVFKRGLINDVYAWDFHSHYPARCYEGIDGKGSYPNPSTAYYLKDMSYDYIETYEGITRVRVKAPDRYAQLLGITTEEGKYIFPSGEFEGYFTNIELRKAKELNYKFLKVYDGIFYRETFKPFRGAVKHLFKLRQKYEKEGNMIMSKSVKLLMNGGLFGKFGQKIDSKTNMFFSDDLTADNEGYCYMNGKKLEDFIIRGSYVYEKVKNFRIPVFVNPILSSYTSSLGRLKLFDCIEKTKGDMIYCDTDSIFANSKVFGNSEDLGELGFLYKADKGIFIKPKFYYIDDGDKGKFKTKGVGKFISDIETFNQVIDTGKVITDRFTKIKESGVRNIPFSSIITVPKNINLEDNKRFWSEKFNIKVMQDSTPLTVS